MSRVQCGVFVVCLVATFTVGCGESLNLLPASGTVTYQGKPLEGAVVTFLGEGNKLSSGTTDAAGHYTISTDGKSGATPGKNQVAITKHSGAASVPQGPSGITPPSPEEIQKMMGDMKKAMSGGQAKPLLPTKYADPAQSGFTADVQAGKATFDFTLTD